jgi:hypothetical protein
MVVKIAYGSIPSSRQIVNHYPNDSYTKAIDL